MKFECEYGQKIVAFPNGTIVKYCVSIFPYLNYRNSDVEKLINLKISAKNVMPDKMIFSEGYSRIFSIPFYFLLLPGE